MSLAALTDEEREVVRRVLEATFHYFDVDFHTRLGITPSAMRALLASWPEVDDTSDFDASLAINNSFNDLLHGVGISEIEAVQRVGVSCAEMGRVFRKWKSTRDDQLRSATDV